MRLFPYMKNLTVETSLIIKPSRFALRSTESVGNLTLFWSLVRSTHTVDINGIKSVMRPSSLLLSVLRFGISGALSKDKDDDAKDDEKER